MTHRTATEGHRVLVAAPFGRDAESVVALLAAERYDATICCTLDVLADRLDEHTGAVLLTEEALSSDLTALRQALERQPSWSDVPFILLAARQKGSTRSIETVRWRLPDIATNVVVLERPLGSVSLMSAVSSAMRSRQKQFQIRDQLSELVESARKLSDSRVALEASEAELRLIADSLPVLIGFVDRDYRYRFANKAYEDWFYLKPAEVIGRTVQEIAGTKGFELRREAMAQAMRGEPVQFELAWPHRDGRRRDAEVRYLPRRGPSGVVDGFHAFVLDITEQKMAEDVLRQAAETLEQRVAERTAALDAEMESRAGVEAALRQSLKMEAVGQLTGGIAHDFNNMLTGVIGSIDMLKRRIASGRLEGLDRFTETASVSAHRAASLTQRLLAFSRRQSLDSKPIDINALVRSLEDLLKRTVSEDVSLEIVLDEDIPLGIADANQLESALLNLAINARDAMPDGGKLTVETDTIELDEAYVATRPDIKAGRYVVIAVSDTGVGMDAKLLEKVFEPFFTTKPIGQGTGLGLSMVYGFARQSNGQVRIHSEPGHGTSVKLYLPATDHVVETAAPASAANAFSGRGQVVLVVEDDHSVRLLIHEVLQELGYFAIEASEGLAATKILASDRAIDLMISDVGLPGINGRQLAEIARKHRPDLPILFVTGYAENAAIRSGFLGTNMTMITKPFALDMLAAKIREMLSSASLVVAP